MRSKSMALVIAICLVMQSFWAPIEGAFSINARAAVLMDPATGKVLYAQNENQRLPPASVTKVLTMLLILEAVHAKRVTWDETITASATAAGMGGSQIYLKEGETMPLRDMFKAIAVVSANDASAAVAEHLYGSLEDFIDAMNEKAKTLGLKNTHFANETGLPDPSHYSSAYDLAVISRHLLQYPEVLKFTSIWLDSLRSGKFILRNTNELLKAYRGADGLKTGHTAEAKFCLSATAVKGGFRLLSVILGADTDAVRVSQSKRLLDYGYRTFERRLVQKAGSDVGLITLPEASPAKIPVRLRTDFAVVVERGKEQLITTRLVPDKKLRLPVTAGQRVGSLQAEVSGVSVGSAPVYTTKAAHRANFLVRWWRMFADWVSGFFRRGKR